MPVVLIIISSLHDALQMGWLQVADQRWLQIFYLKIVSQFSTFSKARYNTQYKCARQLDDETKMRMLILISVAPTILNQFI